MKQQTTRELRKKLKDAEVLTNVKVDQLLDVLRDPNATIEERNASRKELQKIRDHVQSTSVKDVKCVDGKLIKIENNGQQDKKV